MNKRLIAKHEKARLELETAQMQLRTTKITAAQAKYDALDTANAGKRRKTIVERKEEDALHTPNERLQGINLGRDLERNFSGAKSMIRQFRINVVGHKGKVQFHTESKEWNTAAAFHFNSVFAKDCDSRDDQHLCDLAQLTVGSVIREGNMLCVFDDFDEDDGKLLFWESDQLVTIEKQDWEENAGPEWSETFTMDGKETEIPMQQSNGIIRNMRGRITGYVVTGKRGCATAKFADVSIFPREVARLLRRPWRHNQGLSNGDLVTSANNQQDSYEILAKELQSAKVAASFAGKVTRKDGVADFDDPTSAASLPENSGTTDAELAANAAANAPNYDRFESLTGGYMEYLDEGDDFQILDFNRPNVNLEPFLNFVQGTSGASLGLAKAYTTLSADKSYTAFRGDMILTWRTFEDWQKWLERSFFDWVAKKRLQWAIDKGQLAAAPTDLWPYHMSWEFPTMPQVDELKEEKAIAQRLKNGKTDWATILGPSWEDKLRSMGEQIAVIRELGLPLDILETKAGALAEEATENTDTGEE